MADEPIADLVEGEWCEDCGTDDHHTGSIFCPYTADSCGSCGGYHDSFTDCSGDWR